LFALSLFFIRYVTLSLASLNFLNFYTGNAERMRITSGGNLLVGTTSSNARLTVASGATTFAAEISSTGTNTYTPTASTSLVNSTLQLIGGNASGNTTGIRISQSGSFELFFGGVQEAGGAGAFVFQGYSGSAYAERMRISSAGNVGIGTSSPDNVLNLTRSSGNVFTVFSSGSNVSLVGTHSSGYMDIRNVATQPMVFSTDNTERARIDSSGNFIVGGTSPFASDTGRGNISINGASTSILALGVNNVMAGYLFHDGTNMNLFNDKNGYLRFATNGSERARIDSSGNLLVGTTSATQGGASVFGCFSSDLTNKHGLSIATTQTTGTGQIMQFVYNGTQVGSIANNSVLTAYNTTSDYRLKTVVGAVTGQGARIDALKPVEYTWNFNGARTRGFLAHQFQEVYADSVTGAKDAVNAEGNPVYQAMQASTSEVIADLVAEIQSLRQRLSAANL